MEHGDIPRSREIPSKSPFRTEMKSLAVAVDSGARWVCQNLKCAQKNSNLLDPDAFF